MKSLKEMADNFSARVLTRDVRIMEVCGTHTTEFFRTGVKDIFPERLYLVDGPGCPVCVTQNEYLDRAIEIGKVHGVVIATFGDMIKVPSSYSSLGREKAEGMRVEVVYSPVDAVDIAAENPGIQVMFLSVGFETTAPAEAIAVQNAKERGVANFSILCGNKVTVPAVRALLDAKEVNIDGFILPGHVSAIIGVNAWRFIADEYGKPCVVVGFENHDLVKGTQMLLDLIESGEPAILNEYTRVVRDQGNLKAQEIMRDVFRVVDTEWRGIGTIPGSGLVLKDEFAEFDALKKFPVTPPPPREHPGCRCGDLLRGLIIPTDCPLFGKACTPERAVGPCMVSTEGPCSAYYKYGRK
ncbi:MAG: hydrogenase formation protein HypD [Spirochaetes bacterium]|nr:MAG: hydrogenase formation protein HypD [Spirochaetota bacterium]